MNPIAALSRPSRLGFATAIGVAIAALALCAVFEFVVPAPPDAVGMNYLGQKNLNFRSIILYATAGGVHILLCSGGMIFFIEQLRRGETKAELKGIVAYGLMALGITCSVVLLACCLDMNVVRHSFADRVRPLADDARLAFLFARHSIPVIHVEFRSFALFPLLLVLFGVAVAVTACFWVAHKAIIFANRADDLKKSEIAELKRSLGQLISLVAVVFTTSSIATIALMQIGRDWFEKGAGRDAYIQNGYAMGIFWSACYTCVTILMVLLPLWWIAARTRRIQRQAKHAGNRPSFFDQIFEVISFKSIAHAGAAALAPLFTSSLAAVFGS